MKDYGIPIQWPLSELLESGLYFYEMATESYLPDEHLVVSGHGPMLMLGSYSYLGLNGHPRISQAALDAIERYGTGTIGVRLLAGTLDLHKRLEARIASFKETETAVTFSSGFMANVSAITSMVGQGDVVLCDKLDHASIVDGCRLSQADVVRFRHNDMKHLEACLERHQDRRIKLVVVDAVFSMDGDIVDLPEVSRLCRRYGAILMVDEAHSLGVLGATGHGIEEHFGLPADAVDVKLGTFSKAIPSIGGYVATSRAIADAIRMNARGFIFSAAASPSSVAASIAALDVIESEPERVARLHDHTRYFRELLCRAGICYGASTTAIFPIMCGEDWVALRLAHHCQKNGVYVQAVPHPVVPKGSARLRACVNANHRREDLAYCVSVLVEGLAAVGLHEPPAGERRRAQGGA